MERMIEVSSKDQKVKYFELAVFLRLSLPISVAFSSAAYNLRLQMENFINDTSASKKAFFHGLLLCL